MHRFLLTEMVRYSYLVRIVGVMVMGRMFSCCVRMIGISGGRITVMLY